MFYHSFKVTIGVGQGGKVLPTEVFQMINSQGMIELENYHPAASNWLMDKGNDHQ